MANPPFNVDLVDAERAETDKRLPFGLPGINKAKKVANANYLWIIRQVTRKINDFSPEQLSNLTAIVWLHRGQTDRFLGLVSAYLERLYAEADEVPMALDDFDLGVDALRKPGAALVSAADADGELGAAHKQALREALDALD